MPQTFEIINAMILMLYSYICKNKCLSSEPPSILWLLSNMLPQQTVAYFLSLLPVLQVNQPKEPPSVCYPIISTLGDLYKFIPHFFSLRSKYFAEHQVLKYTQLMLFHQRGTMLHDHAVVVVVVDISVDIYKVHAPTFNILTKLKLEKRIHVHF